MTFSFRAIAASVLVLPVSEAGADEAIESFVDGNLIAILDHEPGPAMIDIGGLSIFRQAKTRPISCPFS